jgi:hypothetical protein
LQRHAKIGLRSATVPGFDSGVVEKYSRNHHKDARVSGPIRGRGSKIMIRRIVSCRLLVAALMFAGSAAVRAQDKPEYLSQGWSSADRAFFYTTSQGSQLMPYDWFLVLERPGSNVLLRADTLARFGYLAFADKSNPDALPLGFVKDSGESCDWLGMTCAACHTAQMKFAGKTL